MIWHLPAHALLAFCVVLLVGFFVARLSRGVHHTALGARCHREIFLPNTTAIRVVSLQIGCNFVTIGSKHTNLAKVKVHLMGLPGTWQHGRYTGAGVAALK